MFNIKRKNKNEETIYSPAIGKVIPISEVNDAMFADKLLVPAKYKRTICNRTS